jgi:hypothetical protein
MPVKAIAKDLDGALDHFVNLRDSLELGVNPFSSYAEQDKAQLTADLLHAANDVVTIADELLKAMEAA